MEGRRGVGADRLGGSRGSPCDIRRGRLGLGLCGSRCWLRGREGGGWCGLGLIGFVDRVVGPRGTGTQWCSRGLGLCEGRCRRCGLLGRPPGGGKSGIEGGNPKVSGPSHRPCDLVTCVCGQRCVLLMAKVGRGLATGWGWCDLLLGCGLVEGFCIWGREGRASLSRGCGRKRGRGNLIVANGSKGFVGRGARRCGRCGLGRGSGHGILRLIQGAVVDVLGGHCGQ